MIPNLLEGNDDERQVLREEAEIFIATEIDAILSFYRNSIASAVPPPGERLLPSAEFLTQDWALFRWRQIQLLFALDAYCRYGGRVPQAPTGKAYEKIEHDVLDAHYLILGTLEGAFATREKKLQRWYLLLCSEGRLYS